MNVPMQVPYDTIPAGGVCTNDGIIWLMVQSVTVAINLADGAAVTINNSGAPYSYFPSAKLSFG